MSKRFIGWTSTALVLLAAASLATKPLRAQAPGATPEA